MMSARGFRAVAADGGVELEAGLAALTVRALTIGP
jgi:hypothetical protein